MNQRATLSRQEARRLVSGQTGGRRQEKPACATKHWRRRMGVAAPVGNLLETYAT